MILSVLDPKNYNLLKGRQQTITLLIFFLFIGVSQYSIQAQNKIWMDKNHRKVTQNDGVYYRTTPKKKRSGYLIIDYYKNGNKYREGKAMSSVIGNEDFRGVVTYYYNDGTVSKKEKYKKGELDGPYKEYYPTGELKVDGTYVNGKKQRNWKIYYKSGKIKTKGKYRNGEKVGEWTTYYRDVYYPEDE